MSNEGATNIRLKGDLDKVIAAISANSHESKKIPQLSKASLGRILVREGLTSLVSGELSQTHFHEETGHEVDPRDLIELFPDEQRAAFREITTADGSGPADSAAETGHGDLQMDLLLEQLLKPGTSVQLSGEIDAGGRLQIDGIKQGPASGTD